MGLLVMSSKKRPSRLPIAILPWVFSLIIPTWGFAQLPDETIHLGGRAGWDTIALLENTAFADGWQGGEDIVLADWRRRVDEASDLLVSFDGLLRDEAGNYDLVPGGARVVDTHRRFGSGAAAFDGQSMLSYVPRGSALLTPYSQPGSFSIRLWLYPIRVNEGASVVRWRGALLNAGAPVLQELRFEIDESRLHWTLNNLVSEAHADGGRSISSIRLSARRGLVPERWSHHELRFDATTGQMSYRVDGIPEAIAYLSESGTEDGSAYTILFGSDTGDGLIVGEGYHGVLDELSIAADATREARPTRYSGESGSAFTTPVFLGGRGARVTSVRVNVHEPGRTEVRTWYRLAEGIVSDDLRFALDAPWRELPDDGVLSPDERGAWIQMRFDLLADAERRESPRVRNARIAYRPELPPPIPRAVRGIGIPGGVEIAWDPVVTEDLAGYRVYFGERPRRYVGTADRISPVDVGLDTTFRIEGLRPDGAYVFAVESYDVHGRQSRLSNEVQVRAGRRE